ncbi:hypothetical protein K2173_005219 [Erythroxylum novogranatense]|uniref:FAS1 domain-containing protein n=1 Tax=Erythroxylum novogranatense TaxID=1862640 RepID=A0AAV8TRM1_9ROSI|nr:hypothetical protein K2173_005219 [Erythroxylum novogranatense]
MAKASVRVVVLSAIVILSRVTATNSVLESSSSSFVSATSSPPPTMTDTVSDDFHEKSLFTNNALLGPILYHLGFNELAMAAPSLSADSSVAAWSGPSTLFAPSDSSIRSCFSCSIPNLLREHIVPGLFTIDYLRKLAFGTKVETLSPGRCITVTSSTIINTTAASSSTVRVFIGGVEITQPDLFNNGLVVIHGIQGFVAPLSPFSCDIERLSSLAFPFQQPERGLPHQIQHHPLVQSPSAIMRLMLRDAMLRLRNNGFSVLSLALKVKYGELVHLSNMTIFALDDVSIFSGSHAYISSIRFHIVPDYFLTIAELEKLPVGTVLPSLERGQSLVVTSSGVGGLAGVPIRINYVRIKLPEVMRNLKIVVHSIYLAFPRIHPTGAYESILGIPSGGVDHPTAEESCAAFMEEDGTCGLSPMPHVKPTASIEYSHGL